MLLVGLMIASIGLLILVGDSDTLPAGGIFLLVIGGPIVLVSAGGAVSGAPSLRATDAGLSFRGGAVVPWSAIKQIYAASMDVQVNMMSHRTSAIAIDFHRKRTMFRLPMRLWMASPFTVGDVDVSPSAASERGSVIASKLEAMRVRAGTTE